MRIINLDDLAQKLRHRKIRLDYHIELIIIKTQCGIVYLIVLIFVDKFGSPWRSND